MVNLKIYGDNRYHKTRWFLIGSLNPYFCTTLPPLQTGEQCLPLKNDLSKNSLKSIAESAKRVTPDPSRTPAVAVGKRRMLGTPAAPSRLPDASGKATAPECVIINVLVVINDNRVFVPLFK